jgi:hypothetical protein
MCERYGFSSKEFSDLWIRWDLDGEFPSLKPPSNIAPGRQAPELFIGTP